MTRINPSNRQALVNAAYAKQQQDQRRLDQQIIRQNIHTQPTIQQSQQRLDDLAARGLGVNSDGTVYRLYQQ